MPAKKKVESKEPGTGRNIGLGVPTPEESCQDQNCPFHGNLPVRGLTLEGTVVSDKMTNTVVVTRGRMLFDNKYERYEKRTSRIPAHNPPCIGAKKGDQVTLVECRPLTKTVAFVVVQKKTE